MEQIETADHHGQEGKEKDEMEGKRRGMRKRREPMPRGRISDNDLIGNDLIKLGLGKQSLNPGSPPAHVLSISFLRPYSS